MKVCVVLLALFGISWAAPQNWPYPDSLMPYRYGYPGQAGQYKYLPELEDDEDIGPYLAAPHKSGRQDLVVGEGQSLRSQLKRADLEWRYGDGAKPVKPTEVPGVLVVETGSVAPVKENEPSKVHAEEAPPPPKVITSPTSKPVEGKPVQPPAFPPARPPPTDPPKEKEEDEEDDDDSEEDEADDEVVSDLEHDHDDDTDDDEEEDADDDVDDDEDEDDDDDDRRRKEPLRDQVVSSSVAPVVVAPAVVNSSVVEPASPVVVPEVVQSKEVAKPVVVKPVVENVDESSSEEVNGPPVEALVPGYITEQGEVLVPVDTVIGDQPISIVDDPSSPPARGVPFNGAQYENNFGNYYYPNIYRHDNSRQDESDEVEELYPESDDETDDEDDDDDDDDVVPSDAEGRNEYLTSFPPSRTPELYALIQSKIPVDSNVDYEDYQVYGRKPNEQNVRPSYNGPYSPFMQQRPSVPFYNRPYSQQSVFRPYSQQSGYNRPYPPQSVYNGPYSQQQSYKKPVSFAVALGGYNGQQQQQQQVPYFLRNQYNPYVVRNNVQSNGYQGYGGYNRYQGPYSPYYRPQSPFYTNQNSVYRRPVYQPNPYGGYPRPQYNPFRVAPSTPSTVSSPNGVYQPQINNRIVIHGNPGQNGQSPVRGNVGPRPVPVYSGNRPQGGFIAYRRPVTKPGQVVKVQQQQKHKVKTSNKRKPTPVIKQDDEVYSYEPLLVDDNSSGVVDSSSLPDSFEQEPVVHTSRKTHVVTKKSRRIPKMAKKPKSNKKGSNGAQKKTSSNSDPLNILKKINSKSRRN